MSFQEKSAWAMILALTLAGAIYFSSVIHLSLEIGEIIPPLLPSLVIYTVIVVAMAAGSHIVIALLNPKEANAKLDERERAIFDRAGHWSGVVLGFGVVMALGWYLFSYDGHLMFYAILLTLMVAQLIEYFLRIAFYKRPF
ncbi:MAG: hypothetical protein HWE13_14750 [Gammaproteobacteria bacterium]|nr:hypothetical protein [Gammaproteobacteria bacterium]